jgi:hypothetical protein
MRLLHECRSRAEEGEGEGEGDVERTGLLEDAAAQAEQSKAQEESGRVDEEGGMPELTLRQALQQLNFWMLWAALLVGMGFGFTMLNNMSQIVESLGGGAHLPCCFPQMHSPFSAVYSASCRLLAPWLRPAMLQWVCAWEGGAVYSANQNEVCHGD